MRVNLLYVKLITNPDKMRKKAWKKFYAVKVGRKRGIYKYWYGEDNAFSQVHGYPNAEYKGFVTKAEAEAYLNENVIPFKKD